MSQPVYIQQPGMQTFPGSPQGTMQVPQPWPPRASQPTAQQPKFKPMPQTAQQPTPAPTARAKIDDQPDALLRPLTAAAKLAPLNMPSPEDLGVTPTALAAPVKVDWNETRDRLQRMGCVGFQTGKVNDGRHRVVVTLRTNRTDLEQNIEAVAPTEAEAVGAVLARAEQWVATGK